MNKKNALISGKLKTASLLWPGLLFAALVAVVLIGKPVELQAIPERLVPSDYTLEDFLTEFNAENESASEAAQPKNSPFQSVRKNTPEPKPAAASSGNYEDGVFTGSAPGYGGPVEVQVTVTDRQITAVEILSASGETPEFFNRAMGVVAAVLQQQTWEVDVISGATFSSRGILGAVENALTGNTVENEAPPAAVPSESEPAESYEEPTGYRDGIYTGTAKGFGGDITVSVEIKEGKIISIEIVSASGETDPFFTNAKAVIPAMLNAQSPNVDTVSGATYSSNGIINAVKRALKQAAGKNAADTTETPDDPAGPEGPGDPDDPADPAKPHKPVGPVPKDPDDEEEEPDSGAKYRDGTYSSSGWCFDEDRTFSYELTVTVKIKNGQIVSVKAVRGTDLSELPDMNEHFLQFADEGRELNGVFYKGLPEQIIDVQGTYGVDAVSGATYSSWTIKSLTKQALKDALAEGQEDTEPEDEEPDTPGSPGADEPDTPDDPGTDDPGTPDDPGTDETDTPDDPGTDDPDTPDDPGTDETDTPGDPGTDDPEQPSVPDTPASKYADGSFTASGRVTDDRFFMFEYEMIVTVTVSDGLITDISIDFGEDLSENPEDNDYYINFAINGRTKGGTALPGIPAQVKEKQTADGVDIVSGATYTSRTLIDLIADALGQSSAQAETAG